MSWFDGPRFITTPARVSSQLCVAFALLAGPLSQAFAGAGIENGDRWPSRTIRYAICECPKDKDPKPLCTKLQCVKNPQAVRDAIEAWNEKAGRVIKLMPRDPADNRTSFILYMSQESETTKKPNEWCFSKGVGYPQSNSARLVVIGDKCVDVQGKNGKLKGSIIHETGHAAGLYHEQQRTDRDEYLTVKFTGSTTNKQIYQSGRICAPDKEEICEFTSSTWFPFRTYQHGQNLDEYDLYSVMHYPLDWDEQRCDQDCDAKGRCKPRVDDYENLACMRLNNGGEARLKQQHLKDGDVGQRIGLSDVDVKALDALYKDIPF